MEAFGVEKVSLGLQKSLKSLQLSLNIRVLPFRAWTAFGPRFGTLLGSFWEGIWPPGNAETSLLGGLGPSKSRFQLLFWAPKASKSAPRAFQEASKRPPGCQNSSKSSARGPRIDFRPDLEPVWARISSRFGAILSADSGTETREQSRAEQRVEHSLARLCSPKGLH